jgi:hypothetical protein
VSSVDKAACWIYGIGIVLKSDVCDGYMPLEGRCLNEMLVSLRWQASDWLRGSQVLLRQQLGYGK